MVKLNWDLGSLELAPESSALDRRILRAWDLFRPAEEQTGDRERVRLHISTYRNRLVWALLGGWALFFFTFQFHSGQQPSYHEGGLFTVAPSLFLQEHRHAALDYLLSYAWVLVFIGLSLCYFFVALASEHRCYRFGLAFLLPWLVQFTLQLTFNVASPIRDPATELVFIRQEVFPWSENLVGVEFGALPSGHFGVSLLVLLIARERNLPWLRKAAAGGLFLITWAVLYLGEHFLLDLLVSALIYPTLFSLVLRYVPVEPGSGEALPEAVAVAAKRPFPESEAPTPGATVEAE